jgi:hypothetical protein
MVKIYDDTTRGLVTYTYILKPSWKFSFTGGNSYIRGKEFGPPDIFHSSTYLASNTFCNPIETVRLGLEVTSGTRTILDMKKIIVLFFFISLLALHCSYGQEDINYQKKDTIASIKKFRDWDRFALNLGYFLEGNNSGITLGSRQLGLGVVVDIEDALALDVTNSVFRGNSVYTIGKKKRHSILVDYFSVNRKATKILEADLEIGDVTYPIGTKIYSKFYLSIIRAKYDYSFYQDQRVSLGASFGFFIIPIYFYVNAAGYGSESADMVAPLPIIGIRSDFAIAPKLYLKQSADLLYLKIDTFRGSIVDLNTDLEYKVFKHIGFGAGINAFKLRIKEEGNDYPSIKFFGDLSMEYTGIKFFASYYFL